MARKVHNYDIFAGHAWYVPGIGGMFALLGWYLVGLVIGVLVNWLLTRFLPPDAVIDYGMIVVYPVQFIPAMLYAARQSQRNALFEPGYALDSAHFAPLGTGGVIGVMVLMTYSATLVFDLPNYLNMKLARTIPFLSEAYDSLMELMKQMTGGPLWSSFLTVAIMAPIFEEWLCRGMVLRGLLTKIRPGWAIVLSALFFALIHGNPWQALNAFLIGVMMGYVYYKTGSLKLTMLIHFLNNGTAVILSHIESLKEYDYAIDMFGPTTYYLLVSVSVLVLAGCFFLLRKIPLEYSWGNVDPVKD